MKIAVLAVQGAFIEHERMLDRIGTEAFEIRKKQDLANHFDGLILPGGESTVMGKLLRELELLDELREKIRQGLPVFGTCAGLILLAEHLSNDENVYLGTLPVTVRRNAYGRQLGSFYAEEEFAGIGRIPMAFIRAPYVECSDEIREQIQPDAEHLSQDSGEIARHLECIEQDAQSGQNLPAGIGGGQQAAGSRSPGVEILAVHNGRIVGVRYQNQLAVAFHPEVTDDTRVHEYFLDICKSSR